jgi:hypothetical protein
MLAIAAATWAVDYDFNGDGVVLGWETFFASAVLLAVGITALIGCAYALVKLIRPAWRFIQRLNQFTQDWAGHEGDPDRGIDVQPGVMQRLHTLETNQVEMKETAKAIVTEQASAATLFQRGSERFEELGDKIDVIEHEITTNGGESVKDAVVEARSLARRALKLTETLVSSLTAKGVIDPIIITDEPVKPAAKMRTRKKPAS